MTIDVRDLGRATKFWSELLDIGVSGSDGDFVWLEDIAPGVRLILQLVPETKEVKSPVHLDITGADPENVIARAIELGAERIDVVRQPGYELVVLADPDGNEFCVLQRLSLALGGDDAMP